MTRRQPTIPAAVIVPATGAPVTGAPVTAPPASPWYLAAKRAVQLVVPILPIVATVLLDALSKGTVVIDPKWAGVVTTILICIQVVAKHQKESDRQADALVLQAQGIPVGMPLGARHLERALYSEATLPR